MSGGRTGALDAQTDVKSGAQVQLPAQLQVQLPVQVQVQLPEQLPAQLSNSAGSVHSLSEPIVCSSRRDCADAFPQRRGVSGPATRFARTFTCALFAAVTSTQGVHQIDRST
jgi:hypothetical protein